MFILCITDNRTLSRALARTLAEAGHVMAAQPALEALAQHEPLHAYDGVIADAGIAVAETAAAIKDWRASGRVTPLIALTAHADAAARSSLLDAGADDCLTVPFVDAELRARLAAVTRRNGRLAVPPGYLSGGFRINPQERSVTYGGKTVALTEKEFRIFEYLARHPAQTVTRTMIGEHVWGLDFTPHSNAVDVYISYLRRKLDRLRAAPIVTVRDLGYAFRPPAKRLSSVPPEAV